jgi:lipopolysaccharide transport system ATP-binding protein
LAVGDAQFQEKCIQKMNEMGARGSTILFVSHNVSSVIALCNKGALLERGKLIAYEPVEQCVTRYMRSCPTAGLKWQGEAGDENIRFHQAFLQEPSSNSAFFYQGEKTTLALDLEVLRPHVDLIIGFSVLNSRQQPIARSRLCDHPDQAACLSQAGSHRLAFDLDLGLFHPGEYQIKMDCSILNRKKILHDDILLKFAVCSRNKQVKYELGVEKDGISLGDRWAAKFSS